MTLEANAITSRIMAGVSWACDELTQSYHFDKQDTFPSAEDVKGHIVFNIRGNNYRLITAINYDTQQVIILSILTHAEYDRMDFRKKGKKN